VRIVSLLASATEMVAALGYQDHLVGRSHECDYPSEVLALPVVSTVQIDIHVTSAEIDAQVRQRIHQPKPDNPALQALSIYALDLELLQQLRPDVILTQTQCEVCAVNERDVRQAIAQLTGLHPQVVSLAPYRLQDVWEDVRRIGNVLDDPDRAQILVQHYQQRLDDLRHKTTVFGLEPRVAVLEWLDPLMGAGNWTPELVSYAGAKNLFGEVGHHSPSLGWEDLQMADPDVIILGPCGYSLERTIKDVPLLSGHPIWQELKAVRERTVYAIDGNQYLNRSGPRLVESAELLAQMIWKGQLDLSVDAHGWAPIANGAA